MGIMASPSYSLKHCLFAKPRTRCTIKFDPDCAKLRKGLNLPRLDSGVVLQVSAKPLSGKLRPCRDGWDFPRGWRGFAGVGVTRDALEGLNWPHFRFSSLIAIFECHVCAKGGSGPLTGPCSVGKEAVENLTIPP